MNAVKTNLKRLRTERGLTQDQLAEKLNVVRQTVSSWETGKTTPDVETLTAIAQALDADIAELIYGPRPADPAAAARETRFKRTAALCVGTAALAILAASWTDIQALFEVESLFDPATFRVYVKNALSIFFGCFFLPSAAWAMAGVCAVQVVGLRKPVTLGRRWARWLLIACGGVGLLAYWCQIVCYACLFLSVFDTILEPFAINYWHLLWLYERPFVFFPCGVFLGIGSNFR